MNQNISFPKRLKKLRTYHCETQQELAAALFSDHRTVQHWEKGYSFPGIDSLVALAKHFGVSLDYLCSLTDVPFLKNDSDSSIIIPDIETPAYNEPRHSSGHIPANLELLFKPIADEGRKARKNVNSYLEKMLLPTRQTVKRILDEYYIRLFHV